ncbi:unnamed protein product [Scytosiphon promiscuus]
MSIAVQNSVEANPAVEASTTGQGASTSKKSRKKPSRCSQVLMCISDCKYDVVREAARAKGWKLVEEDPEASTRKCHVYWIDVPAIVERMQHLHRWQRINHFPGMSNVARKGRLAQNLDRMRRKFPQEYSFYPRTWVLPVEWGAFKTEFDTSGRTTRTFIIKPDSGCQGRGIFLTQDLGRVDPMESQVAQLYVQKPLLIEGFKFDLRLYVLVTSVIPLRVYAFKDGLTRFCTEEYARAAGDNLGRRCMHLTNYAVNKSSENFVANDHADRDDLGSKRSLRWLLGWVAAERGGQEKADALWRKMGEAITRTLVSALPTLHREYLHTFGRDEGVRRQAAGGSMNIDGHRNDQDPIGVNEASCGDVPPPPQEGMAGGGRPSQSNSHCTVGSAGNGHTSGPSQESDNQSLRTCRRKDGGVGSADCPPDDSVSCAPTEVGGECAPPKKEREGKAPTPSAAVKVVEGCWGERCDEPGSNGASGRAQSDEAEKSGGAGTQEILGFDFMIDAALKPWLIEVNHLPSFATDSPLDRRIKAQVVATALSVLHAKAEDRRSYEENAKRDAQNRLYNPEVGGGSAQRESQQKEAEAAVAKIRRKLEAIYGRFAPHKLGKVGGLLERYAGEEEKLLRIVRRKYVDTGREKSRENAPAASAGAEGVGPGSMPLRDDPVDGQATGDNHHLLSSPPAFTGTLAPVHGSENSINVTEETGGQGHRSHESIIADSTGGRSEGQTSRAEERSLCGGGGADERKQREEGFAAALPPEAARTPEPPHEGTRGGGVNLERTLHLRSFSPHVRAQQQDYEALSREAGILKGWERLHPPLGAADAAGQKNVESPPTAANTNNARQEPNGHENEGGDHLGDGGGGVAAKEGGSGGGLRGGGASGWRRRRKAAATVEVMIQQAFEDDRKMTLRLKCPLQQQRGGAMDLQVSARAHTHRYYNSRCLSVYLYLCFKQNHRSSAPPVVLGPEQREKAQRLMEGYSSNSRRSSSAPPHPSGGVATSASDERSTLPVSLRIAVIRAKEWRRRRDEGNARKNSHSVAVKMHTFDFGGVPGEGGHQA